MSIEKFPGTPKQPPQQEKEPPAHLDDAHAEAEQSGQEKEQEREASFIDHYRRLFEDAFEYDSYEFLPVFNIFGEERIDTERIKHAALALVEFIEEKERVADENELDDVYQFARTLHADLFSMSPNIVNYIRLPDRLKLMTRATRSNVIQGTFGSVFVGETVYDLSFMEDKLDMTTVLEDLSTSEQLDLLHQLRTVGAQAIASGKWARPAYAQVRTAYETVRDAENTPAFIHLAADAGLDVLDKEYKNPQLGVIRFEGQTSDSRLYSRFIEESTQKVTNQFFSSYKVDEVLSTSTKIVPAARDAVVCTDKSGLATGAIRTNLDMLLDEEHTGVDFDVNRYRIYLQHLEAMHDTEHARENIIAEKIFHEICDEQVGDMVAAGDADGAASVFSNVFPVLTKAEWGHYFSGEIKKREMPTLNALYLRAAEENGRASRAFVQTLFTFREALGAAYQDAFAQLEQAVAHEDDEYAYEIASMIVQKCRAERSPREIHTEIPQLQKKLEESHRENFSNVKQEFERLVIQLRETEEMQVWIEMVMKLQEHQSELHEQLKKFIEQKLSNADDLPSVEYVPLRVLVRELHGGERAQNLEDEDVLLFQHVHSSELAHKIEETFGFKLQTLTLREQYFFLNYLKRVPMAETEPMTHYTSRYGVDGMRTFLSLEHADASFGEKIVAFGNTHEAAGDVFASYGALLDEADALEGLIRSELDCDAHECERIVATARERLVRDSYEYLRSAVEGGDENVAAGLNVRVRHAKALAAGLSAAFSEGKIGSVERLNSFRSEKLSGADGAVLDDATREQLLELYRANYPDYTEEGRAALITTFLDRLGQKETTLHTWKLGENELLAFGLATEKPETREVYLSGLNVNPQLDVSRAGKGLLLEIMGDYLERGLTVTGEASPKNAQAYFEMGFVGTAVRPDADEGHVFDVAQNSTWEFASKKMTRRELVARAVPLETPVSEESIVVYRTTPADIPSLPEGYVVTRLFRGAPGTEERYMVLERARLDR